LKQAAAQRLESVRAPQATAISELERILLRALVLPDADAARELAASELGAHPEWYAGLPSATLMETLANASAPDNPMDAAADGASRSLLAIALHEPSDESREPLAVQVRYALTTLHRRSLERQLRELRTSIANADRVGDQELLSKLTMEMLAVHRALREL
jgi:DNA primase